jgi:hypothetical protein
MVESMEVIQRLCELSSRACHNKFHDILFLWGIEAKQETLQKAILFILLWSILGSSVNKTSGAPSFVRPLRKGWETATLS